MLRLLAISVLLFPLYSAAQFFGVSAAYTYDGHLGTDWRHSRGAKIGVGVENHQFMDLPLTFSFRYFGAFSKSRFNTTVDDIEFDLPDSIDNRMGFANLDYKKFSAGIEADLGYQEWEFSIIEPYVSFGLRYQNFSSWLNYDLYEPAPCQCYDTRPKKFTETASFGFTTGAGVKIHATETFFIDFRATYNAGWGLTSKGGIPTLPDTDSFHINSAGAPTVNYAPQRYIDGMNFNVGIIFNLRWASDQDDTFSFSDSDDNDYDYGSDGDVNTDSGSSSTGSNDCDPVELTPKGRGGN